MHQRRDELSGPVCGAQLRAAMNASASRCGSATQAASYFLRYRSQDGADKCRTSGSNSRSLFRVAHAAPASLGAVVVLALAPRACNRGSSSRRLLDCLGEKGRSSSSESQGEPRESLACLLGGLSYCTGARPPRCNCCATPGECKYLRNAAAPFEFAPPFNATAPCRIGW